MHFSEMMSCWSTDERQSLVGPMHEILHIFCFSWVEREGNSYYQILCALRLLFHSLIEHHLYTSPYVILITAL